MEFIVFLKTVSVLLILLLKHSTKGGFVRPQSHTLPDGLQSLDGSDTNGGCSQGCLMGNICGDCTGNLQLNSTLVDGVYPRGTIDTAQPDWAMDFFTVNRNGNDFIQIGFDFTDRFIPRGIEVKLFNCESLGTVVSNINVYISLLFPTFLGPSSFPDPIGSYQMVASDLDCDSLSTIIIPTNVNPSGSFKFYFIEFIFSDMDSNTAVYLAEFQFSDEHILTPIEDISSTPQLLPTSTTAVSSSQLPPVTSLTPVLTLLSSSTTMPTPSTTSTGPVVTPSPSTDVNQPTTASLSTSATTTITSGTEVAFIRPESHTLPVGLQSLDGSDTNGGCRQECLMGNICGECTGNTQLNSTLVDGVYPRGTIDTAQPDWAMDFFTVNRNGDNRIRIGFDFFDPFILRGVELKLFNCESLGTAVPNFNVYTSLLFPTFLPPSSAPGPIGTYETTASDLDCTSLTTITIPTNPSAMFRFYFIEFSFFQVDSNSAVYVAEIRFVVDNPVVVPNEITTSAPQLLYTSTAGTSSSSLPTVISSSTLRVIMSTVQTPLLSSSSSTASSNLLLPEITSLTSDLISTHTSVLMLSSSSSIMPTITSTEFLLTSSSSSSTMPTITSTEFMLTSSSPSSIMPTITSSEFLLTSSSPSSIMPNITSSEFMLTSSSYSSIMPTITSSEFLLTSSSPSSIMSTITNADIESVVTNTPLPSNDVYQPNTPSLLTSTTITHTSRTTNTDTMSATISTLSPTMYIDSNQLMPTSTPSGDNIINTHTSDTTVPTSNPDDVLASGGLTTIVGVLVGIIIALIIIILIGAIVVALCRKKMTKKGNYNVKILQVESSARGQNLEVNSFYTNQNSRQLPTTDDHYEVMHKENLFSSPGYAEVNVNGTIEPIYSEVRENKHVEETKLDEDFYDTCVGGSQASLDDQDHPYSTVVVQRPPPVPMKTPELYRALKLEAKQKSNDEGDLVSKCSERSSSKILHENSEAADGDLYSESGCLDLSASVHSGLALLSKPVFENMDTNPEYDFASDIGSYTDETLTNPDAIPIAASGMEPSSADMYYSHYDKPVSTSQPSTADMYYSHYDKPVSTSQMESNTVVTYSSPKAVPVSISGTDDMHTVTNPDTTNLCQLFPAIYDTVHCESSVASISNPDVDSM